MIIVISLSFLHELQKRRKLYSQERVRVSVAIPIDSPSCVIKTRYFHFVITSCQTYRAGVGITVLGRVDRGSDEGVFKSKRLMIESIEPYSSPAVSLKYWSLLTQHHIQLARGSIYRIFQQYLPPYQAGLVLALVFGTTEWLASSVEPYFEVTGTLHILAASGQNISLLLLLIDPLVPRALPTKLKGTVLLLACFSYLTIVGLQPSLLRATVMAALLLYSRYFVSAQHSALYSLLVSSFLILLLRPEWLMSIGFLLSVAATLGIIVLYPKIAALFSRVMHCFQSTVVVNPQNDKNTMSLYIIESTSAGVAAQLATFPILFTQIGVVQWLAFIPSTVVAWMLPLIMSGSFMLVAVGGISTWLQFAQPLSKATALLIWLPADLFAQVLEQLAKLPWGEVRNPWLE